MPRTVATSDSELVIDPKRLARTARLRYVADSVPGFQRRRRGRGYVYLGTTGRRLTNRLHLERIESLVIPPAWEDVWICRDPNGHLQATGRDEKGRKQYRYHARWTRAANWSKFARLRAFGEALPGVRRRLRRDLESDDDRTQVLALMALLLDVTAIRVGNREYAREHEHYGLTTLLDEHVLVEGDTVRFEFIGKSGKERNVVLEDAQLVPLVRKLLGRKGERLFEVRNGDGVLVPVEAEQLNAYLRDMLPAGCTAKMFRTWRGTVAAFEVLAAACDCANSGAKITNGHVEKTLREAIKSAALLLGNTTTVCRAYYVHPALCDVFSDQAFAAHLRRLRPKRRAGLKPAELRLLALLRRLEC